MHEKLFAAQEATQLSLLALELSKPKVLCRDGYELSKFSKPSYSVNWWKHQANMVIGLLLMPRCLVSKAVEPFLIIRRVHHDSCQQASNVLSELFDVVVRIRVDELHPPHMNSHLVILIRKQKKKLVSYVSLR